MGGWGRGQDVGNERSVECKGPTGGIGPAQRRTGDCSAVVVALCSDSLITLDVT